MPLKAKKEKKKHGRKAGKQGNLSHMQILSEAMEKKCLKGYVLLTSVLDPTRI